MNLREQLTKLILAEMASDAPRENFRQAVIKDAVALTPDVPARYVADAFQHAMNELRRKGTPVPEFKVTHRVKTRNFSKWIYPEKEKVTE